jgi:ABC-type oligopeptide transport system ATPase subunit
LEKSDSCLACPYGNRHSYLPASKEKKINLVEEAIKDVGLKTSCLNLYPHEFSGGQRQRIAIARALILEPKLLIADEPVSALDASIQAQIINLLKELKQKRDLTILFISHDMNVIKYLADRIGIMNKGKIIEEGYTNTLFKYPKEDYTKTLLNAVPELKST